MRKATRAATALGAVLVAAAAFGLGRATAPDPTDRAHGTAAYLDGLRTGRAEGRREGRALQEGSALPADDRAPVRDAFTAGYTAGADDVFAGYDGGWTLGVPWVVTLERGTGPIAYRIARRTPVEPGVGYRLCPDGSTLCRQPR
jgi:hypothetical protein